MPAHAIATITSLAAMRALLPEWLRLFYACRAPNPFAHPLWLLAWARHFTAPSQLFLVALRAPSGALVGVAPFYQRAQRLAPGLTVRRLQLLGAGRHVHLTELPQVLLAPGHARTGLRDLLRYLAAHDRAWDCVELTLAPDQGWFEREWLPRAGPGAGSALLHKATRPCVVVPLPASVEEWQAGLKRNVKESIRRGANRLARGGTAWARCCRRSVCAALSPAANTWPTCPSARTWPSCDGVSTCICTRTSCWWGRGAGPG